MCSANYVLHAVRFALFASDRRDDYSLTLEIERVVSAKVGCCAARILQSEEKSEFSVLV
jgi:hypothetical protein